MVFPGFGGTNAHVILESFEPDPQPAPTAAPLLVPFVFSAASKPSLVELLRRYHRFCQLNANVEPRFLAWTLHARRSVLPHRVAISASSIKGLSDNLGDLLRETMPPQSGPSGFLGQRAFDKPNARVWGIFTGQSAQWARMGAKLVEASDLVRGYIARLDQVLANLPAPDRPSWTILDELLAESHSSRMSEASVAQPVCTAIQIVLVQLLRLVETKLHCVIGHSSGEIGAAYAAGLISDDEAIRVAFYRGKFAAVAQNRNRGAMLAVHATLEEVEALLELDTYYGRIQTAAHNSPNTIVLSGDEEAIEEAEKFFKGRRQFVQRLKVDTAYHSHHMLPCAKPYIAALEGLKVESPKENGPIWYSTSSIPSVRMNEHKLTPQYWATNMTSPVHFFETVAHVLEVDGTPDMVLELGPHPALQSAFTSSVQNVTGIQSAPPYHGLLSRGHDDIQQLSSALGEIWRHLGIGSVNFDALDRAFSGSTARKQVVKNLPQYPFDHSRSFGALSRAASAHIHGRLPPHPLLGKRCFDLETTHEVTWRNVLRPVEIPWLSGHRLQGQLVFPATAYLSMAIESIILLTDKLPSSIIIEGMAIERAIVFGDEEASVEILYTVKFDRSDPRQLAAEFACYSSLSNDTPMARNACGCIIAGLEEGDSNMEAISQIPKELYNLREVTRDRFYSSLEKMGYEYQSPFNGIHSIQRKLGYAMGEINDENKSFDSKWEDQLLVHPGMMDSALQTISAAASCPGDGSAYTMNVPTRIDRLILSPKYLSKSKTVEFTSVVQEQFRGETTANVYLVGSKQSNPFMQIEGVHVKPLTPPTADDDEMVFSEFLYGPYHLDGALVRDKSTNEELGCADFSNDQAMSLVWMVRLACQLAHRYPRMRILEVGKCGHTSRLHRVRSRSGVFFLHMLTLTTPKEAHAVRLHI